MRFFNTAGPMDCQDHYCLPPLERWDLGEILTLIGQKKYFVLHAPRQTGKTSCLLALMEHLNRGSRYASLYINVETGQAAREDVTRAVRAVLSELGDRANLFLQDDFPEQIWPETLEKKGAESALNAVLTKWCQKLGKPLVLLIDEIDSLVGDSLISVLRQIRAGYDKRKKNFPQSVILCGVRDVRDYRIHSSKEKEIITGGSAFNVKAESLRLGNFSREQVSTLYCLHTSETGQKFDAGVYDRVWEYTKGQPWLVNAIAYEACFKIQEGKDRTGAITADIVARAKENLILRRETHLDQLADKLTEDRVRRVIAPLLTGTHEPEKMLEDDIQYVFDLGLIEMQPRLAIANAIYKEIIPRTLTVGTQELLPVEPQWYIRPDGLLDSHKLLAAFQDFFREHSEHWVERFDYKEAGPQLLLQAFLQRIVNSGGSIDREYGLGSKRTDLMVKWPHGNGVQKIVMELKILHKSLKKTIAEGCAQLAEYMDKCGSDSGHLIVFDRDPERKWEDRIFQRDEIYGNKKIKVWGM